MIDAFHLKAHRVVAILLKKGLFLQYRVHKRRVKLYTSCVADL